MSAVIAERLLTTDEVAEQLRVTRRTVENWRSRGLLPSPIKFAQSIRWRQSDIDAAIEQARIEPAKECE